MCIARAGIGSQSECRHQVSSLPDVGPAMMTGHFLKTLIFFLTEELAFHVRPQKFKRNLAHKSPISGFDQMTPKAASKKEGLWSACVSRAAFTRPGSRRQLYIRGSLGTGLAARSGGALPPAWFAGNVSGPEWPQGFTVLVGWSGRCQPPVLVASPSWSPTDMGA